MDDSSLFSRVFIFFALLGFSGFFSACEAAFFSLTQHQIHNLAESGERSGKMVQSLLDQPRRLLITIYIGNEIVNVATAAVATSVAINLFGNWGVAIAIGSGTFLLLICGEIVPKTLAIKFAEKYCQVAVYPLTLFSILVNPIQKFFIRIAEMIISSLGFGHLGSHTPSLSEEEFKTIVKMGEGEGLIEEDERQMINNVFDFGDTTVKDIMTPKAEMFTLDLEDTLDNILPRITRNFYSRVPVYDMEGEVIEGVLYTKDLNKLKLLPSEKFNLKSVLREPLSVPETKKIKDLLKDFKKMKKHMAIVLNEYGSVTGLVTLEDVLEELVGEIDSEMRPEKDPVVKLRPNVYRIPATYSLSDFNRYFECELPEERFDTLGGFVFDLFGRVPRSGDSVTDDNIQFTVVRMKGPRILSLELTLLSPGTDKQPANLESNEESS